MKKRPKKRRPFAKKENPRKLYRKMTEEYTDVLQNIEFALVTPWREHPTIDDRTVAQALTAAMVGEPPREALAKLIFDMLNEMRQFRRDITDETWKAGLKVVLDSVRRHSDARSGDRGYLNFASQFIV